jgi:hypothetical protein
MFLYVISIKMLTDKYSSIKHTDIDIFYSIFKRKTGTSIRAFPHTERTGQTVEGVTGKGRDVVLSSDGAVAALFAFLERVGFRECK